MADRIPARLSQCRADAAHRVLADLFSYHATSVDHTVSRRDRPRPARTGRNWLFAAIAIVGVLVVGAVWLGTGGFLCLLLVDYVWNSWHFAAQHAGILRMYSRKAGQGRPWLETWGLRSIVFYTSVPSLAGWSTGWTENWPAAKTCLTILDAVVTLPVLALLCVEIARRPWERAGKVAYLASVSALYLALLAAIAFGGTILVLSLTAAAAAFHAVEYLAVVTHYAHAVARRDPPGCSAPWRGRGV